MWNQTLSAFSSVNYKTEVDIYKRISDVHRKRWETLPIYDVISKTSKIVFTSPNVVQRDVEKMQELNIYLSSSNVLNYDIRNTYLGRCVFLCVENEPLFQHCFCRRLFLRQESPNFL